MRFLDFLFGNWSFPEDQPSGMPHPEKGRHDEEHRDLIDPPDDTRHEDPKDRWGRREI